MSSSHKTDVSAFVLSPQSTLSEALERLESNGAGVAAVVESEVVVGTVIDADIRRAMLRNEPDTLVADVMSSHPVTAEAEASDERLRDLMMLHRVRAVPIVDDRRLIDVRSLDTVVQEMILPRTVIMAGGEGRRLRPLTEDVPKPLVKIGDSTILEHVIRPLQRAGIREITLAVNYKAEMIKEYIGEGSRIGIEIDYVEEEQKMGTAGALALLPEDSLGSRSSRSDRPICVANADIVTTMNFARLFDYHWHHRAAITIAAVDYTSSIPYGVLRTAGHYLVAVEEKPQVRSLVSGGIYVIDPEVLRFIRGRAPLDMPDLVADVLAEGLPVCVFPVLEQWFDVGRIEDLERARDYLAANEGAL